MNLGEGLRIADIVLFLDLCDSSMIFCFVVIYVVIYSSSRVVHFTVKKKWFKNVMVCVFKSVWPFKKHSEVLANCSTVVLI